MMKWSLLIVFVFVTRAAHATHAGCCTAQQFQISFGGNVAQTINGRPDSVQEFFHGAFDFKKQQYGMDVYLHNYTDGSDTRYKVYQLINKGVAYIVMDSQCYQIPVGASPSRCVPDFASYVTSFYLGNHALWLDNWRVNGSYSGFVGEVYSTTAAKDCTPGPTSAVGTMDTEGQKVSFISQGSYMNFTGSITQPDYWFMPPASCSNGTQLASDSWFQPLRVLRRMRATHLFL